MGSGPKFTRCNIKACTKALAIARASSEKKARDIVTIDMRKMSGVCDYFVIASGTSTTHVRAIADNIAKVLKEKGERLWHKEGEREALWVLLDCGDVVAHIFLDETRRFYDLESLWAKAPRTRFAEAGPKTRAKIRPKTIRKSAPRLYARGKAGKKIKFKTSASAKASLSARRSARSNSRKRR